MVQYVFGTGNLYVTNVDGSAPLRIGALQDVSIDFGADIKTLHGQFQFPLDAARGKTKIEWKASTGEIDVRAFNTYYFGQSAAAGEYLQAVNEAGTVPGMSTYTVTVAHAADFYMDLGVYNAATGLPLVQVAAMPADGQYSVSAGVYTFNSAQASVPMLFNYLYEGTNGFTVAIGNPLMGAAPQFRLVASQIYRQKTFTIVLYGATAEKLSLPLKQDDYLIGELSGQAFANDANQIGFISSTSI